MVFKIPKSGLIAMIIATAFFMQNLDSTIVATALPQIARSFDTDPVALAGVITSYLLAVAVFLPLSGWLADRYGASRVFRGAIAVFTVGSVLCGVSQGPIMLILARIVQGMGGAMMIPVGRLVLLRSVSKSEFVEVMAYLLVPSQLGQVLGPPIGGWIATYTSWRWAFLVNLPMGVIGIWLATRFITLREEPQRHPLDWSGFLMTGVSLSLVLYGTESLRDIGADPFQVGLILIGGLVLGVAAVWHALHQAHPVIDVSLLRIPTFFANFVSATPFRLSFGATLILLPLSFQIGLGLSAFESGLLIFASAVGNFVIKPWTTPILRRFGFRRVLVWNSALIALSTVLCGAFLPGVPILLLVPVLVILGFTQSLHFTCLNTLCFADIAPARMSGATGFSQMGNQIANTFGVSLAAVLLQVMVGLHGEASPAPMDFTITFVICGSLAFLSIPMLARLPPDAGTELYRGRASDTRAVETPASLD